MSSAHPPPVAPTGRTLRQFSWLWILFFGAVAARQELHYHRHGVAIVLALMAVILGLLGIVRPQAMKPIFVGWMAVAYPIGWTVSRLILGLLFYGLFTPVAFAFRIAGRDGLGLKPRPQAGTYWRAKPGAQDKSRYLRQF